MKKQINVLVIDDSAFMRKKITQMIEETAECQVIGTAKDGLEALKLIPLLKPDVITLDLELPKMDGLSCLKQIMTNWPTPVIVLSAFSYESSASTLQALELGAVEFIMKPDGVMISLNIDEIKENLIQKIKLAAQIPKNKLKGVHLKTVHKKQVISSRLTKIIAIGASTGGPSALVQIMNSLPGTLNAGVLIIQHIPHHFLKSFISRLNQNSELNIKEAEDQELITPGTALVVPTGYELQVETTDHHQHGIVRITPEQKKYHHISPSIDVTFTSLAQCFEARSIGVILTGMGKDGTEGCRQIKKHGGVTFAQDKSTSIVYGMPQAATEAGVIDHILSLTTIPSALIREVGTID